MGSSHAYEKQAQTQFQPQGRRPLNDGVGKSCGNNQQPNNNGDGGRGGWGCGGPGLVNQGPGGSLVRGRGGHGGGAFGPAFGGMSVV